MLIISYQRGSSLPLISKGPGPMVKNKEKSNVVPSVRNRYVCILRKKILSPQMYMFVLCILDKSIPRIPDTSQNLKNKTVLYDFGTQRLQMGDIFEQPSRPLSCELLSPWEVQISLRAGSTTRKRWEIKKKRIYLHTLIGLCTTMYIPEASFRLQG